MSRLSNVYSLAFVKFNLIYLSSSSASTPLLMKWRNRLAYLFIVFCSNEHRLGQGEGKLLQKLVEIPAAEKLLWCASL